jgi:hypothetical protein
VTELTFEQVRAVWISAGGADTLGILHWFEPPAVERWVQDEIRIGDICKLRLLGSDAEGGWEKLTGGTNPIGDLSALPRDAEFRWDSDWALITVRDPENGERVLLDGNKRAIQAYLAAEAGVLSEDLNVRLITGDLNLLLVRIAKAISPLWR